MTISTVEAAALWLIADALEDEGRCDVAGIESAAIRQGARRIEALEAQLAEAQARPVGVEEAARVLLDAWEKHGEGLHGHLSCYALEGEEGEPFEMVPNIDGGWVKFHDIESALRALSGEAGE